ncbi:CRISPR-associated endonuclease Cas2 [Chloroflexus sp.]|uniref:CRISPR-associated endonuclease Cas2 n=1 Tax=Chloroflexus sp. TaxID=1904827 RepID=UPI002ACEB29F|nr:CRISPR-associated endonuclease Cas2 [Chloroflexus sp.]
MQCLVIYDIPDDRARQRVADACLDYGLQRIQYSAFAGNLSRAHQRALFGEIARRVKGRTANVQLFAFDAQTWSERRTLEQNYDDA